MTPDERNMVQAATDALKKAEAVNVELRKVGQLALQIASEQRKRIAELEKHAELQVLFIEAQNKRIAELAVELDGWKAVQTP